MRALLDQPWKNDDWYSNQWRAFYRLRVRRLVTIYRTAGGIGLAALLFAAIPDSFQDKHPYSMNMLTLAGGLAWICLLAQWFWMNWQMTSWDCPRCDEPFFARNPFRRRCSNCGLRRPRQREVGSLRSV